MLKYEVFVNPPFMENTYLLYEDNKPEALLIDPGGSTEEIATALESKNLKLKAIINTHGHIDHIVNAAEIQNKYKVPFYLHQEDLFFLQNCEQIGNMYGICGVKQPHVNHFIEEGKVIKLNDIEIEAIHTPGHSPGSVCFLVGPKELFSGDLIFLGSIGRTDLPGGNMNIIMKSIEKLMNRFDDDVKLYSGHGNPTSIGYERRTNPFYVSR